MNTILSTVSNSLQETKSPLLPLLGKKNKYATYKCLSDMFREQVKAYPNSKAVVCNDDFLTYEELYKKSLNLALYLQYHGINENECVGVLVSPSLDLMVGIWGVLHSGAGYLPLAMEYPEERIKYMIKNAHIKIVYTQPENKEKLKRFVPEDVCIITDEDVKSFTQLNIKNNFFEYKNHSHENSLAYIIYTSGSTGNPKGVMIEQKSIVNQMVWLKNTFNLNNHSIILQKTSICFDAAQWEILAVCCGSQVVINSEINKEPLRLLDAIKKYNVTVLQCVPTLLQALLDTDELHTCRTLTHLFSGGEALSKLLALKFINILSGCQLINLYGPTECTINTSSFLVKKNWLESRVQSQTVSIGMPIAHTHYYILNKEKKPVKMGEIGELYIGGKSVARGYYGMPDLTAEKFIDYPWTTTEKGKLYKTGDLVYWNEDNSVQYVGRIDNQVKLRGFRIELDEIKSRIETHDWVKHAAVILTDDPFNGHQNLIAFVELDPKEAALMDQGNHDVHHQTKENKAQVIMQLANAGLRERSKVVKEYSVRLPGKMPTKKQQSKVFARKTYRFFDGESLTRNHLINLLKIQVKNKTFREVEDLEYKYFGEILRYFGQYLSEERLLPKYGYASPGALYATQLYLELNKVGSLPAGFYYYHPIQHQLICIKQKKSTQNVTIKIHLIGKKSAIEPIYKNNILEVLEMEAGHMIGLLENILPDYGLNIKDSFYNASVKSDLKVPQEDFYLGSFEIVSGKEKAMKEGVDIYVQSHSDKITNLPKGQYLYEKGELRLISDRIVLKKDTIAINQAAYARSSFGITIVGHTTSEWMSYINLGRKLQKLQMNDLNIGLMSSGYSSKTGNDLLSAKKIAAILNEKICCSYFVLGGPVSQSQVNSRGMKEDTVHMKGPAEILKEDLEKFLPNYMIPNKIIFLDKILLNLNGKIDTAALKKIALQEVKSRILVLPRDNVEQTIWNIWKSEIKKENISVNDNFFELGGNSLIAVSLVNKINVKLNLSLSFQMLFKYATIEKIAHYIKNANHEIISRLIPLKTDGMKKTIYCWPGLGGYCMNLRLLAEKIHQSSSFYGMQTYGINKNEIPYSTLTEMALEDIKLIKKNQANGPYTLWGYSFGARIAFEVAYQLEKAGETIENLFLIAPGSPRVSEQDTNFSQNLQADYSNKTYVTILFSVFMGRIAGKDLEDCLKIVNNQESFVSFIVSKNPQLDVELVRNIVKIVSKTYELNYSLKELKERQLNVPITVFKAKNDSLSFIENVPHVTLELEFDHYSVLKSAGVDELMTMINR